MKISNSPMLLLGLSLAVGLSACSSKARDEAPPLPDFTLSVTKTGNGTVISSPAGINCGVNCVADFASGTEVTLTPTPDAGNRFIEWGGVCAGTAATNACDVNLTSDATASARFFPIQSLGNTYGLTSNNELVSFNRLAPENILSTVAVTGLEAGELLVGMDFRASNGLLYAVGTGDNLYRIDHTETGPSTQAVLVGELGSDLIDPTVSYGVDINPVVDAMRLVGSDGTNLVISLGNAAVTTATDLPASASVSAVAYTNNFVGATGTVLLGLDSGADTLVIQNPPNDGALITVGSLGVDFSGSNGFEIDGTNLAAFAALTVGPSQRLYTINVRTGAATLVGSFPLASTLRGLSIAPSAAPPAAGDAYALTPNDQMLTFNRSAPATIRTRMNLLGLDASVNESLVGFDFRPRTGQLIGLSDRARVFEVNVDTGLLNLISVLVADPADSTETTVQPNKPVYSGLSGTHFGVDIEPVFTEPGYDKLKVVNNASQNLIINIDSGETIAHRPLNRQGTPSPTSPNPIISATSVAAGYLNAFDGAATGPGGSGSANRLFAVDAVTNNIVGIQEDELPVTFAQTSPNGRLSNPSSPAGINIDNVAGLDIDGINGEVYIALSDADAGNATALYRANISTGQLTLVGPVGSGAEQVESLALIVPEPAVLLGVYADGAADMLIKFQPLDTTVLLPFESVSGNPTAVPISGLESGERVVAIDFRARDERVYILTSADQIYLLNENTGAATAAGAMTPSINDDSDPFSALGGALFDIDFNPVVASDAVADLRIVSDANENVRVVATQTGGAKDTFTDGDLNVNDGGDFDANGVAYTNNYTGAVTSSIYIADPTTNFLYLMVDAAAGGMEMVDPTTQFLDNSLGSTYTTNMLSLEIAGGHNGANFVAYDVTPGPADEPGDGGGRSIFGLVNTGTGGSSIRSRIGPAGTPALVGMTMVLRRPN